MKRTKYLELNTKRLLIKLPGFFFLMLLFGISIVILGVAAFGRNEASREKQKIKIAICGDYTSSYLGVGIETLSNFDSSRYAIDFVTMEKDEAVNALYAGKISAYAVIPNGYISLVNEGVFLPIEYESVNDGGVAGGFVSELCDVLSVVLSESNAAILSTGLIESESGEDFSRVTDKLFMKLVGIILNREDMFFVHETGVSRSVSFFVYMKRALAVLFILMMQLAVTDYFCGADGEVKRYINSRGINAIYQVIGEIVPVFVFELLLAVMFGLILDVNFFGLMLITTACMSIAFFICELTGDVVKALASQSVIYVLIGYLSGCFMPPFCHAFEFLYPAIAINVLCEGSLGRVSPVLYMGLLAYILLGVCLTVLVRRERLR